MLQEGWYACLGAIVLAVLSSFVRCMALKLIKAQKYALKNRMEGPHVIAENQRLLQQV